MQSNRTVAFVLVVLLAVGAVVAWQFFGADSPTLLNPDSPGTTASSDPATGTGATAEVDGAGIGEAGAAAGVQRDAVAASDPQDSDLPCIVGQIVDAKERPIAAAAIQCTPGIGFMPDFDNLDTSGTAAFGPEAVAERMGRQARDRITVRSDAEGRFRIAAPGDSRTVNLRVLARGHLVLDRSVPRPIATDTDLGLLTLQTGAVVAGRVLDPQGRPIVGARVARLLEFEENATGGLDFSFPGMEAMDDLRRGESSVTDEAGRFELAHIVAGDFMLRARHADHPTAKRKDLSVAAGQTLADVLLTMSRGAEIRGTVVGVPEGTSNLRVLAAARPAANASPAAGIFGVLGNPADMLADMGMAVGERNAELDDDGAFVVRGLDASKTYRVWVAQQGRGFAGSGTCSDRIDAPAGSSGIELRYEAGITVTFLVVDAQSDAPIERLWVRDQLRGGGGFGDMMAFVPGNTQDRPYPDGSVTVANLRPKKGQTLRLTIDAIGYARLQRDGIELPQHGSLDLGKLSLDRRPIAQVTVLAADNDQPLAGARVQFAEKRERGGFGGWMGRGPGPQSGRTDDAGQCTLNVPDTAMVVLEVTKKGYAPVVVEIATTNGDVSDQTVRLIVGGTAAITVLGADRAPVQDANVEHRTPTGTTDRQRTDAAGVATFEHLTPGAHAFRVAANDGPMAIALRGARRANDQEQPEAAWQSVDVVDRGTAELVLEKAATARLRGIVRENGMPLAGATVAFVEGQDAEGPEAVAAGIMGNVMGQLGQRSQRQDKTAADGTYELSELPAGEHQLRITHRDRAMPTVLNLTLHVGDNRLDAELDMTSIQGVVRDPQGNAVSGARLTVKVLSENGAGRADVGSMVESMMPGLSLGGRATKTDASGMFELRGVQPDVRLQVTATAKGMAPTTAEASVARGQISRGLELRLGAAGRIKVTVEGAGMFAAVTARFIGDGAEAVAPVVQMLRRGKGTLDGLRPGSWEVEARAMRNGDDPVQKRTVQVLAGETTNVDL